MFHNLNTVAIIYSFILFIGLMVFLLLGHWFVKHKIVDEKSEGGGSLDGVVFALLGLLLAFNFSNSINTYGKHRELLTNEANSISDLISKIDFIDDDNVQKKIKEQIKNYAMARLIATESSLDSTEEFNAIELSRRLQIKLWVSLTKEIKSTTNTTIANQLVLSFNDMATNFDYQLAELNNKPPSIIYILFFLLSMFAALLAGHNMADRKKLPLLNSLIFSISVSITIYTIIDMGTPKTGFFNSITNNYMLRDVLNNL